MRPRAIIAIVINFARLSARARFHHTSWELRASRCEGSQEIVYIDHPGAVRLQKPISETEQEMDTATDK